ncbi:isochorismatase family protein [Piscinibacter sakaiensis]|uniref:isochorismatase family protein n=1 Tax=Piscinibacter sakaiensis TaxID=1547922 RepID=UPI003AB0A70E
MIDTKKTLTLNDSVLVLVDYQPRLLPAIDSAEKVLEQAVLLADVARTLGVPVIGTEQNPAGLGTSVAAIGERCDTIITKTHFNACADGLLDAVRLARAGRRSGTPLDIVVAGCEAHVCLLQTSMGLLRSGHRVWIAPQACGSRRPADHALAMQRLQAAGATLVSVEMVAFEWLHHCRHAEFMAVLQLIKAVPTADAQPLFSSATESP